MNGESYLSKLTYHRRERTNYLETLRILNQLIGIGTLSDKDEELINNIRSETLRGIGTLSDKDEELINNIRSETLRGMAIEMSIIDDLLEYSGTLEGIYSEDDDKNVIDYSETMAQKVDRVLEEQRKCKK